ncbi:MAG: hypothetical protein HYZ18_07970 [Pseudogulbenkiania sp.]|nr:hypothetical protein [Pseudogulbenkiania sp.]
MLSQRQRWAVLGGALVLSLVLAGWPDAGDEGTGAVVEVAPRSRATVKHDTPSMLLAMSIDTLQRSTDEEGTDEVKDIFTRQSWYVPPPPPKSAPPAPPAPPPLPFTYLGKVIDGAQVTVFVTQGDRNLAVKTGDVIDGTYRVDAIAPPMMTITFLPLSMQQSLEIGGAN